MSTLGFETVEEAKMVLVELLRSTDIGAESSSAEAAKRAAHISSSVSYVLGIERLDGMLPGVCDSIGSYASDCAIGSYASDCAMPGSSLLVSIRLLPSSSGKAFRARRAGGGGSEGEDMGGECSMIVGGADCVATTQQHGQAD